MYRATAAPRKTRLEPLFEALDNGDSIILFPEGTRGNAEEPQPFKAGLYNLAVRFPQRRAGAGLDQQCAARHAKGEVVRCRCCAR